MLTFTLLAESIGKRRLVRNNTTSENSGRLEVFLQHKNRIQGSGGYDWLPICITKFNMSYADQFCRELGYLYFASYDTVEKLG